jgi:hypothetical protein
MLAAGAAAVQQPSPQARDPPNPKAAETLPCGRRAQLSNSYEARATAALPAVLAAGLS